MENFHPPHAQPRRQDRTKDDLWISQYLKRAAFGTLATTFNGQPFLKPTLFAYDEQAHAIYFHSALEGRARINIQEDPRVCFSAAEMGRLLPAQTAMEFGMEYASVVVFGSAVLLSDENEARYGLQMLLDKYFPHLKPEEDYRPIIQEELNITAVFRLDITAWSGKQERAPDGYPGAFFYNEMKAL